MIPQSKSDLLTVKETPDRTDAQKFTSARCWTGPRPAASPSSKISPDSLVSCRSGSLHGFSASIIPAQIWPMRTACPASGPHWRHRGRHPFQNIYPLGFSSFSQPSPWQSTSLAALVTVILSPFCIGIPQSRLKPVKSPLLARMHPPAP